MLLSKMTPWLIKKILAFKELKDYLTRLEIPSQGCS
jgi:hypothetical protein